MTTLVNDRMGNDSTTTPAGAGNDGSQVGHPSVYAFGGKKRGKQGNYLDTGSQTIAFATPLPNGEIPEVALRFAVGNSSGHFHPWYADVQRTGDEMNWDSWQYNQPGGSQRIVHMDSSWMRLKWGGLGAESVTGLHNDYTFDKINHFFGESADAATGAPVGGKRRHTTFGFANDADAKTKLDNAKLFSLATTNAQGIVGLIPYVDATSITVDAFMTPTHAGLRQPIDRTFEPSAEMQKASKTNAITDYAHINFPIEQQHPGVFTTLEIEEKLNAYTFKSLPAIPRGINNLSGPYGNLAQRSDLWNAFNREDHGKQDMYGWGGHPTEFFVNPFSNGKCTFYTHLQPPYGAGELGLYGVMPDSGGTMGQDDVNILNDVDTPYDGEHRKVPVFHDMSSSAAGTLGHSYFWPPGCYFPASFIGPDGPGGFGSDPAGELWYGGYADGAIYHDDGISPEVGIWGPHSMLALGLVWTAAQNKNMWEGMKWNDGGGTALSTPATLTSTKGQLGAGQGTSYDMSTIQTPDRKKLNGAGIRWPAGHPHADYFDYRDWTGSMGLGGAGSKEALALDDVWDTFYCSYTVYSTGSVPPQRDSKAPLSVIVNCYAAPGVGGMGGGTGHMHNAAKIGNDPSGLIQKYHNLVFPDDFVKTIGDPITDPFHDHRDYNDPGRRIYGNVNILFKIPERNQDGTYVIIESDTFDWTPNEHPALPGVALPEFTGKPAPAITFDLGDSKFIFENNKNLSITIENYGVVVGGGGSGGSGTRAQTIEVALPSEVQEIYKTYGGGGGGGGASGGPWTASPPNPGFAGSIFENWGHAQGIGQGGSGWAQLPNSGIIGTGQEDITEPQKGKNGNDIDSEIKVSPFATGPAPYDVNKVGAGGLAATAPADWTDYVDNNESHIGGDGGDVFYIKHGTVLPIIYIINKQEMQSTDSREHPIIVSGGGGGGGGMGYYNFSFSTFADGAPGARAGRHGNPQNGEPGIAASSKQDMPVQFQGGDAGYIVGGQSSGIYPGKVIIVNESYHSIRGKHPSLPVVKGKIGFEVNHLETKTYE
jgi:hypothetical protein